ncbi:hypothetical protein EVAR_38706_1 [Eumeta japonica]|uniref:Uncharacterized protein n=1 Tax=Eumeta variegata TaxID=151549 RepID=A0A4C1XPW0_EUMVA|nr:hypothetical protein EVAR_38706_1 [Eumeta japonica]
MKPEDDRRCPTDVCAYDVRSDVFGEVDRYSLDATRFNLLSGTENTRTLCHRHISAIPMTPESDRRYPNDVYIFGQLNRWASDQIYSVKPSASDDCLCHTIMGHSTWPQATSAILRDKRVCKPPKSIQSSSPIETSNTQTNYRGLPGLLNRNRISNDGDSNENSYIWGSGRPRRRVFRDKSEVVSPAISARSAGPRT